MTGECTADFLTALVGGGKAFIFTFDDDENALITYSSIVVYDVTFLRVSVQSLQIWLHVEDAAFLLSSGSIGVSYNDWARSHYSKRANISVPDLQLSCVNSESAARHQARLQMPTDTDAFVKLTIDLAIVGRKFAFSEERRLQQNLVQQQALLALGFVEVEIGAQHRRCRQRHDQRNQHCGREHNAEFVEKAADNAAHKRDRRENRDQRQAH